MDVTNSYMRFMSDPFVNILAPLVMAIVGSVIYSIIKSIYHKSIHRFTARRLFFLVNLSRGILEYTKVGRFDFYFALVAFRMTSTLVIIGFMVTMSMVFFSGKTIEWTGLFDFHFSKLKDHLTYIFANLVISFGYFVVIRETVTFQYLVRFHRKYFLEKSFELDDDGVVKFVSSQKPGTQVSEIRSVLDEINEAKKTAPVGTKKLR